MATLILETGLGLVNSNTYASLEYADAYFENHPFYADTWSDITDEDRRRGLLIHASRYLDTAFDWHGYQASTTQAMQWPRTGVHYRSGLMVPARTLPREVADATCEQAVFMARGDPYAPAQGAGITELKVDVIELVFDKSIKPVTVASPVVALLRGLADFAGGMRVRKVLVS